MFDFHLVNEQPTTVIQTTS